MSEFLRVTEQVLKAAARRAGRWASPDGGFSPVPSGPDPFAAIEADMRSLIAEAARARSEAAGLTRDRADETRAALLAMIEVADALERVIAHAEERAASSRSKSLRALAGNVSSVHRLLLRNLGDLGVEAMPAEGEFDPHIHVVGELVSDPSRPAGSIAGQVRRGYCWGELVLRKSELIVVGQATTGEPSSEGERDG